MKIPLVALEEHHEAFFVWYYARESGWLAESGNVLLHVDEHADLNLPLSRHPLPERHDLNWAARYTYTRTDIACFIWPAVYSGAFDKIYWLRRKHDSTAGSWRRVKLAFAEDRSPFAWKKEEYFSLDPIETAPGEVACEYAPLEPGDRLRPQAPFALDIDLDYFASNYPPDKPKMALRLEEKFAREIIENPYHWTKVEGNTFVAAQDSEGSWILTPREEPFYPARAVDARPPEEVIPEALARFGAYLDEYELRPSVITLCRSEYSGYSPRSSVRQIEEGVRRIIKQRYDTEEYGLNSILPEAWRVPAHLLRVWPW